MTEASPGADPDLVGEVLAALNTRLPYELVDVLREKLAAHVGATGVRLWLADYEEVTLEPLADSGIGRRLSTSIDAPGLGHAYRNQEPYVEHLAAGGADVGVMVFLPVTLRSERIGVLELTMAAEPSQRILTRLERVATAIAYVLLAARRYTDVFELARRRKELELPAELQWEALPVLAHSGPDFSLAGSVEPAYDIGGDNFDYAIEAQGLTISLTDAMGHGTQAALLSTLAVSAQRNARRRGHGLRQQVRAVNVAVHDHFDGSAFATGLFLEIDRATGAAIVVNAGHSLLWLQRGTDVEHIAIPPDLPAGLFADAEYIAHQVEFVPGERVLLISDGVLEATDPQGRPFGADNFRTLLCEGVDLPPFELVRLLTRTVADWGQGAPLADDATAVCLDYRRG